MKTPFLLIITEFFLISFFPTVGASTEKTLKPISFIGCSKVQFPHTDHRPSFILEISNDHHFDGKWQDDHFLLRLSHPLQDTTIAETRFYSSSGEFALYVVDITGDGIEEYILIYGKGRGTSARRENVVVFQRSNHELKHILHESISDYYGPAHRWWYERKLVLIDQNHTVLRLVLDTDPVDTDCMFCDLSLIPKEEIREFIFDQHEKTMVSYPIAK